MRYVLILYYDLEFDHDQTELSSGNKASQIDTMLWFLYYTWDLQPLASLVGFFQTHSTTDAHHLHNLKN